MEVVSSIFLAVVGRKVDSEVCLDLASTKYVEQECMRLLKPNIADIDLTNLLLGFIFKRESQLSEWLVGLIFGIAHKLLLLVHVRFELPDRNDEVTKHSVAATIVVSPDLKQQPHVLIQHFRNVCVDECLSEFEYLCLLFNNFTAIRDFEPLINLPPHREKHQFVLRCVQVEVEIQAHILLLVFFETALNKQLRSIDKIFYGNHRFFVMYLTSKCDPLVSKFRIQITLVLLVVGSHHLMEIKGVLGQQVLSLPVLHITFIQNVVQLRNANCVLVELVEDVDLVNELWVLLLWNQLCSAHELHVIETCLPRGLGVVFFPKGDAEV